MTRQSETGEQPKVIELPADARDSHGDPLIQGRSYYLPVDGSPPIPVESAANVTPIGTRPKTRFEEVAFDVPGYETAYVFLDRWTDDGWSQGSGFAFDRVQVNLEEGDEFGQEDIEVVFFGAELFEGADEHRRASLLLDPPVAANLRDALTAVVNAGDVRAAVAHAHCDDALATGAAS